MPENKVGRPKGKKYTIRKEILLTPKQAIKWNPDNIREFLDNGKHEKKSIFEESDFERAIYKYLYGIVWRGKTEDLKKAINKGIKKVRGN